MVHRQPDERMDQPPVVMPLDSATDRHQDQFKFRQEIACHTSDVRSVAAYPDGGLVTASRDKTCKLFLPRDEAGELTEVQRFTGPEHFVGCVTTVTTSEGTFIFAGSNDSNLYSFTHMQSTPYKVMMGHSGVVCAIRGSDEQNAVLSGSWDSTARLWKNFESKTVFVGHTAAVWDVAFLSAQNILTASADTTIKLWSPDDGKEVMTYKGHKDVVRSLAVISETEFLSASNDVTIRRWNVAGEVVHIYEGHENFIYSIAIISRGDLNSVEFVSCSEDRTLRCWSNDKCTQTIRVPATTVWSVAVLTNEDIVVGASNGHVYVFSRNGDRIAPLEGLKAFDEQVAETNVPKETLGDMKVSQLPGKEALLAPGKHEGQNMIVREDGGLINLYQWNSAKFEWVQVGKVVGAAEKDKDPTQSKTHQGKEYDYVFDVDIADDQPRLKLPYNIAEDPWHVAQRFIHEHSLSQNYLDQVAQFIIKNSEGMSITATRPAAVNPDPFTGGGSYTTGSGLGPGSGPGTDSSLSTSMSSSKKKSARPFPVTEYLKFDTVNLEGITRKLVEHSEHVPPEVKLLKEDIKQLLSLADVNSLNKEDKEVTREHLAYIKMLLSWPRQWVWPAIDLMRLALLLPDVSQELCGGKESARLIDTLLVATADSSSDHNNTVALRALVNMFHHPLGVALLIHNSSSLLRALEQAARKVEVKNIRIALVTLYLNFTIYFSHENPSHTDSGLKMEILSGLLSLLKSSSSSSSSRRDPETEFRALVALGTLSHNDSEMRLIMKSEEVFSLLREFAHRDGESDSRSSTCAAQLLATLEN